MAMLWGVRHANTQRQRQRQRQIHLGPEVESHYRPYMCYIFGKDHYDTAPGCNNVIISYVIISIGIDLTKFKMGFLCLFLMILVALIVASILVEETVEAASMELEMVEPEAEPGIKCI